jgi:type IV pilus assembly protein PilP
LKYQNQRKKLSNLFNNVLLFLLLWSVVPGCSDQGGKPVPSAPAAPTKIQQPITQATATVVEEKTGLVYTYNPVGRRDPFAPLIEIEEKKAKAGARPPLERYNIPEFKLTGVVWGGFGYNAMLEGPDGKGYFVRVGTIIGPNRGVIKKITKDAMMIEEKYKNFAGEIQRKEITVEFRKKQEGIQ